MELFNLEAHGQSANQLVETYDREYWYSRAFSQNYDLLQGRAAKNM